VVVVRDPLQVALQSEAGLISVLPLWEQSLRCSAQLGARVSLFHIPRCAMNDRKLKLPFRV
jgi:hypothetical protein